jgi:hypothetical protein
MWESWMFGEDVEKGEWGEGEVLKNIFLNKKEGSIIEFVDKLKTNSYDFKLSINGKEISYEVKTDSRCTPSKDTGNMYIEFICLGKPSGISVTKADWFVMYFDELEEMWYIKTDKLRELINNSEFPTASTGRDPATPTTGYLIKRKDFKKHFTVTYPDTSKPPYKSFEEDKISEGI